MWGGRVFGRERKRAEGLQPGLKAKKGEEEMGEDLVTERENRDCAPKGALTAHRHFTVKRRMSWTHPPQSTVDIRTGKELLFLLSCPIHGI